MKKRRFVSLFNLLLFAVMAGSGVWAFAQPFSIQVIGLHALTGFIFIAVIGLHIANNFVPLKKYSKNPVLWFLIALTGSLGALFYFQPSPIKAILGLSGNLGPALDRFEMNEEGMKYDYVPHLPTNCLWISEQVPPILWRIHPGWRFGWRISPFITSRPFTPLNPTMRRKCFPTGPSK